MAPLGEALQVVYEGDRDGDASSKTSVYRGDGRPGVDDWRVSTPRASW